MIIYDLIDSELKEYYIEGHKWIFIVFLFITVILTILSFFNVIASLLSIIFAVVALVFLITWNMNKRKYGNKLSCYNGIISIYDYKNSKIKEFQIKNLKGNYMKIAFDEYPRYTYRSCLILYIDFEPYENMEYSSYWNEPNILIIQNPTLISIIGSIREK